MLKIIFLLIFVSCGKYKTDENLDEGLRPKARFSNSLVSLNPEVGSAELRNSENLVAEIKAWRVIQKHLQHDRTGAGLAKLIQTVCFVFDDERQNESCLYDDSIRLVDDKLQDGFYTFKTSNGIDSELILRSDYKTAEIVGSFKIQRKAQGRYLYSVGNLTYQITLKPFKIKSY